MSSLISSAQTQDVGSLPGVKWTLSSHKPGAAVAALRDPDLRKLWQSDGTQPHVVDIQFPKRTAVTHLSIYLDTAQDDSYTPTNIGIKAGSYFHDLVEVRRRELDSPRGWVHFALNPLGGDTNEEDMADGKLPPPIWTYHIQVNVYANHLNGKDTHLRSIKVFGPSAESSVAASAKEKAHAHVKKIAAERGLGASPLDIRNIRYEHAYDTLRKIIEGRTDLLEQQYDFDLDDEAEGSKRSTANPADNDSRDHLPAASRNLFLAHQLR